MDTRVWATCVHVGGGAIVYVCDVGGRAGAYTRETMEGGGMEEKSTKSMLVTFLPEVCSEARNTRVQHVLAW